LSHRRNNLGEGKPVHSTEIERRKHPRFNAQIPIDIGLIDLGGIKKNQGQFKGVTTDISMEGLGLELDYPASDVLSFAPKLMGKNKQFDLDLNANLGRKGLKGIGEVRWARIHPPSLVKMGVFLREMRADEKEKWADFVIGQGKGGSQDVSCRQWYSGHRLIQLFHKFIRDPIHSNLYINYILPITCICSSVVVYWFAEMRYYHATIPWGFPVIMILLIRSRFFSRKHRKAKSEISHS
jgi:hypothetical protein